MVWLVANGRRGSGSAFFIRRPYMSSWRKKCKRHPELELSARTQQFVRGYLEHGNAARAARAAEFGTGPGARRVGYKLLRKPYIRAAIEEMKAAILNRAHQRAEDEARAAALAREAELERLARVELTALLDLEDAERKQKLLRRMHREVMHGGRYRVGSQGGAQSRFARVCRQYRGEPTHREPGRCCCGKLATSPRGASCDYCRERNRHYRRRYRAKVRASSRLGARLPARRSRGSLGMPRFRCVDSEPSHRLGEAAVRRLPMVHHLPIRFRRA